MKSIKGWLTTGMMVAMIALGSMVAKADDGIIYGNAYAGDTSKDGIIYGKEATTEKNGIIYGRDGSILGIIYGYFGIIYG
jgi:hypothetical protein